MFACGWVGSLCCSAVRHGGTPGACRAAPGYAHGASRSMPPSAHAPSTLLPATPRQALPASHSSTRRPRGKAPRPLHQDPPSPPTPQPPPPPPESSPHPLLNARRDGAQHLHRLLRVAPHRRLAAQHERVRPLPHHVGNVAHLGWVGGGLVAWRWSGIGTHAGICICVCMCMCRC